jgi:hypothetical protein
LVKRDTFQNGKKTYFYNNSEKMFLKCPQNV